MQSPPAHLLSPCLQERHAYVLCFYPATSDLQVFACTATSAWQALPLPPPHPFFFSWLTWIILQGSAKACSPSGHLPWLPGLAECPTHCFHAPAPKPPSIPHSICRHVSDCLFLCHQLPGAHNVSTLAGFSWCPAQHLEQRWCQHMALEWTESVACSSGPHVSDNGKMPNSQPSLERWSAVYHFLLLPPVFLSEASEASASREGCSEILAPERKGISPKDSGSH